MTTRPTSAASSSSSPRVAPARPELKDHVALVTGASSGIGESIAVALGASEAIVCLVGRRREELERVLARVGRRADRARTYPVDLTRDDEVRVLAGRIEADFKRLDVLVHCAGTISLGPLDEAPAEALDAQYAANVRAPYQLTQALLPLIRAGRGQIVFINSSVGKRAPGSGVGQFAATQHALKALADSLRDEVNADGVRVLSVFPGRTATPRQQMLHQLEAKEYAPDRLMQPEDVASAVLSALALPRTAEITEISIRPLLKPA
jgi:NAD(P)-dependent dehydrogenase (short-subunit alcohol dehydrogenase family)